MAEDDKAAAGARPGPPQPIPGTPNSLPGRWIPSGDDVDEGLRFAGMVGKL